MYHRGSWRRFCQQYKLWPLSLKVHISGIWNIRNAVLTMKIQLDQVLRFCWNFIPWPCNCKFGSLLLSGTHLWARQFIRTDHWGMFTSIPPVGFKFWFITSFWCIRTYTYAKVDMFTLNGHSWYFFVAINEFVMPKDPQICHNIDNIWKNRFVELQCLIWDIL